MKKSLYFILISLIVLGTSPLWFYHSFNKNDKTVIKNQENKSIKQYSAISMMYEISAGSGEYTETNETNWPSLGYTFNSILSKCDNGSTLTWDDTNKKVLMSSNASDKCYVYFDKATIGSKCAGENMASCIKENYQLDPSILLHNASLTNGANNGSYRYTGGDYKLTSKATTAGYTVLEDNLVNFYCNGSKSTIGSSCSTSNAYYYNLAYDTGTQYSTYNEALAKAVADGYLEDYQVKNYVCFGSDAATCPIANLYRIVGVFGSQVKLIKYDYANTTQLGTDGDYVGSNTTRDIYSGVRGEAPTIRYNYYWNYRAGNSAVNNWTTSLLNKTNLNTNYLNNIGSTWSNKIATTTWKVGGNTYANIASQTAPNPYKNEISSPAEATTYSAKIGLMYVSDYGYATDQTNWTTTLSSYSGAKITSENWMYMGHYEWTISRRSDATNSALYVNDAGRVSSSVVSSNIAVRPSFYLVSSTVLQSGSGTAADPYRII